ncbi:spore germination protein (amino acid permease) [Mesobacillus persicus]|uniref:Spore germination protein (Amino acid permease) n=1 Tax=Mesobacillus persicus TaxID=930146 RepID=A0A1H7ZQT7_9BACI|nr:GerAB/ArcD/ProY family transporter [Mesobacillus persicus]SEM60653.1 spore germination protein (amino acid permease) [Mesobacillus persicus]
MKQTEGKIGIREYTAIIMLSVGTKLTDDTPTVLFNSAKNSAWISLILIALLSIVPIWFLVKVFSVHQDKNLHDLNVYLFGKVLGHIISVGMLAFGFSALVLDSAIYVDIISSMYFTKTPSIAIYVVLVIVCGYGAKRGLQHIGSTAWLTLFYLKITLLFALAFAFYKGNTKLIFPLWGPGYWEIVKTAGSKMSIFADFYYLGIIAPMIDSFKSFKKGAFVAFAVVVPEILLALMIYVMLFDFTSIEVISYPFHEMILYISIGFLTNVETFFLPFWLVAAFVRFAFYFYLVLILFGAIFKIKEYEYLVPVISILVIFLGVFPKSAAFTIPGLREWMLTILSPMFFLLPCFMWLIAKVRGDFKNETSAQKN